MLSTARNILLVLFVAVSLGACASLRQTSTAANSTGAVAAGASRDSLSGQSLALHLLNRLAFGPRPGDVARVMRMGADRWIDEQLRADSVLDPGASAALAGCKLWTEPVATAEGSISGTVRFPPAPGSVMPSPGGGSLTTTAAMVMEFGAAGVITRDSAANNSLGAIYAANSQLIACKYARVEFTENQLLEVMTDFWHNHFSFPSSGVPTRGSIVAFDRATIRPRALGRFRDLLGAVAHSPAMLQYLDNAVSQADTARRTLSEVTGPRESLRTLARNARTGLNENYARELLELHTLGADGGYTQQDVVEVARALTGWTHSRSSRNNSSMLLATESVPTLFVFDSATHDAEAKIVLGHALAAGRGMEDGEDVLDILARHPATARFIARKLAVRFVSDSPPESLVERAAQVFLSTDGDIREVVRAIVTSREFRSPAVVGAKVKSPLEFVLSLRRVFSAPVDTAGEEIDLLVNLRQPPYGRLTPDGWPETGDKWLTVGAMKTRLEIISALAYGELPSIPVERWPEWKALSRASFTAQLNGVIAGLLNGQVSANTRGVMASVRPVARGSEAESSEDVLRELIVLALSSPEFMRR